MHIMQSPPGPYTVIDGTRYLYFAGTAYLGLQGHPEVIAAACAAAQQYGIGTATSRGGFGGSPPVLEVERRAAQFMGTQDAFYFASGFMGPAALVSTLATAGSTQPVFVDEASHYSVLDAAHGSGQSIIRFRHGDADDLRAKLARYAPGGGPAIVLSDGVFSAMGDIAPVPDYLAVLKNVRGARLVLDDAHGVGVLGERGRGTLEHFGLTDANVNEVADDDGSADAPDIHVCATLSKAMGGYGGVIAGSGPFVALVKRQTHLHTGASAPANPVAGATARAIRIVMSQPELRTRLAANVHAVKAGLHKLGLEVGDTPVPIIGLELGSADDMARIAEQLKDRGIVIGYLARYAGLTEEGALRIAVFANHTDEMIGQLLDAMREVL